MYQGQLAGRTRREATVDMSDGPLFYVKIERSCFALD